jgi:ABC-type nitrate/sulfonate/bicarbonate transport system substrate-binding protein
MSTIALQKWVAKELVHGPVEQSISDPIYLGGWVVNVLFVQQHPELAQKVLAIFERTIREIVSDPDAARQYLKWNTPLADDLIATIALPFFKTCDQLDSRDVESLQTFYDIFTQYNVVPNSIQVMDILYCTK